MPIQVFNKQTALTELGSHIQQAVSVTADLRDARTFDKRFTMIKSVRDALSAATQLHEQLFEKVIYDSGRQQWLGGTR